MKFILIENITNSICQNLIIFSALYIFYYLIRNFLFPKITAKTNVNILLLFLVIGVIQFFYTILYGTHFDYIHLVKDFSIANYAAMQYFVGVGYVSFLGYFIIKNSIQHIAQKPNKSEFVFYNNQELQSYFLELCAFLQIKTPAIYIASQANSAYVKGFFKKFVILPTAYLTHMTEAEIEAVLLHEIAHIKQGHLYTNLIVIFSETIFYFNPFVKNLVKELRLQREIACDDWVIQFLKPKEYASALQKAAFLNQNKIQPSSIAFDIPKHQLLYRIKRLFNQNSFTSSSRFNFKPFLIPTLFFIFIFSTDVQFYDKLQMTNHSQVSSDSFLKLNSHNNLVQNKSIKNSTIHQSIVTGIKHKNPLKIGTNLIAGIDEPVREIELIPVSNKTEQNVYSISLSKTTSTLNDFVFSLVDSTVFYSPIINIDQFNNLVNTSLKNQLELITHSFNDPSTDIICQPAVADVKVTQNKVLNPFYNNVQLKTNMRFHQAYNKWMIDFMIMNNDQMMASKLIDVTLVKKLKEISL